MHIYYVHLVPMYLHFVCMYQCVIFFSNKGKCHIIPKEATLVNYT